MLEEWAALVAGFERSLVYVPARIFARVRAELPTYRTIPEESLREIGVGTFEQLVETLRARRRPELGRFAEVFREAGARRARDGVPAGEMLQTMQIAMEEVRRVAEELIAPGSSRDALLLEFSDIVLAWRDRGTMELTRGHRAAELDVAWREAHHRSSLVSAVLLGGLPPAEIRARVQAHGLDPDAGYHPLRARPDAQLRPSEIEYLLGVRVEDGHRRALVAWIDGDVCGFVRELPARRLPVTVGVAAASPLLELPAGFRLASRALDTAVALGRTGVHDLASLGLHPAILADPDVSETLDRRYVEPLERRGPAGAVILDTVERYLRADCRAAETAAALFVHKNTLRYRLNRFEELTRCSLRSTETLSEVWWALERRRMRGGS